LSKNHYIIPNYSIPVNNAEMRTGWKEAIMPYFEVLTNHGGPLKGLQLPEKEFKPGISQQRTTSSHCFIINDYRIKEKRSYLI
jgi:hypothetical protein